MTALIVRDEVADAVARGRRGERIDRHGQELTARTRYRGLLKRRLFPVEVQGPLPAPGTPVTRDGAEVGEMRSGRDALGLALLRIGAVEDGARFDCGEAVLTARIAGWMTLPAREPA